MQFTPKTNPKLFGHAEAEAQLLHDFSRGQLAHGWILSGPRGIGKATLAYRFARTLLSGQSNTDISPEDPIFLRMVAGSHSDLLVVEPLFDPKKEEFAQEINVDQAREIVEFLSLTPGEGAWRVVIIDSIDALNTNAANAILKILEEPPPQAILLLISHNPGRLLPTIRSRCRFLPLKTLNEEQFLQIMRFVNPEIEKETAIAIGQLTNLSPGIALNYHELGAISVYNQILDLLSFLPALNNTKLHAFAEKIMQGHAHANWKLFTALMLCLFERSVLTGNAVKFEPLSEKEAVVFLAMQKLHPTHIWAAKWQEISNQFFLVERQHLDYKQCVIIFFHSLMSTEEFRIGSIAA